MTELKKAAQAAHEALLVKTVINNCGTFYVVDPDKAADARVMIDKALQKNTWFNLSRKEVLDVLGVVDVDQTVWRIVSAIEEKLREKNA